MKNVTIVLDEEVARWARIRAAERDTSVSRLVGEMLRDEMRAETRYDAGRRAYEALATQPLKKRGARYPTRSALHDRAHLR